MRTWFITGGTPGGFGMAYAEAALEIGDRVVLTARRTAQLEEWSRNFDGRGAGGSAGRHRSGAGVGGRDAR
jgi:NADP-dependent 3-hydroxy acid dehydrogenase YdfG